MKIRISKRMVLPLLYGVLAGWVVAGAITVWALLVFGFLPAITAVVSVSALLLIALFPALRRSAVVYSKALKYHRAEYLYDLGNGVEASIAVNTYEKKARRAVSAWLQRKLLRSSFGALPVASFALLLAGTDWIMAFETIILIALMVLLAVAIGLFTMLRVARRYCYDKFGNIRNIRNI
ncbi:MAG: ABC transporter permease [Prevotella sp.]|nr:ABC transporter permease [Prevotella sp.]